MVTRSAPAHPDETVVARWRRRLVGDRVDERSHWRTKTAYYRAVDELIRCDAPELPTWRAIVDAVHPVGSRSTFYEVTGPKAKHALVRALQSEPDENAIQLALCYQRSNAVHQLIDETKVWSFWPYRTGWLEQLRQTPEIGELAMAESLVWVVAEWARRHPQLATALDHAPPACAVEDLLYIRRDQVCAVRAHKTLTQVVASALGPLAEVVGGVADAVRADLGAPMPRVPSADDLLAAFAEKLYALSRHAPNLPPSDAALLRRTAAELMSDALQTLTPNPADLPSPHASGPLAPYRKEAP
jgi:hypothetical protein